MMNFNPAHAQLTDFPFDKLRALLKGVVAPKHLKPVPMQIGEPKHPTPAFIKAALIEGFTFLDKYPPAHGPIELRSAIARWLERRYGLACVDEATEIIPALGTKESLFSIVHALLDTHRAAPTVVLPDPFYQVYEAAVLFAGAKTHYIADWADAAVQPDFSRIPASVWRNTQLLFVCTPDNPTGRVLTLETWKTIFELSEQYGFIVLSDECYSEIFFEEGSAPLGALEAAQRLGRTRERLVVMGSLSKRSNAPGLRSGYIAGDPKLLKPYLLYRTFNGSAMSGMVAHASIAAWNDETHVVENRAQYKRKFFELTPQLAPWIPVRVPDAAFYWWPDVSRFFDGDDTVFTRELFAATHVTVLPGTYLGRALPDGVNPGRGRVRLALVNSFEECAQAVDRIKGFVQSL
jgi:N-succinyldiaminopimelate aminotransferase